MIGRRKGTARNSRVSGLTAGERGRAALVQQDAGWNCRWAYDGTADQIHG
jgi:hypothetical protein